MFLRMFRCFRRIRALTAGRRCVAFAFNLQGMEQFYLPVIRQLERQCPDMVFAGIFYAKDFSVEEFENTYGEFKGRIEWIDDRDFVFGLKYGIDVFVSADKFVGGLARIYSICSCYAYPAKGVAFTRETMPRFDAFFMVSQLARENIGDLAAMFPDMDMSHVGLIDIGYPKSDALMNNEYSARGTLEELGLDPDRKTVLYAPAFNAGASLREHGFDIIRALAGHGGYNVICKLPIDCWKDESNLFRNGNVNWNGKVGELMEKYPDTLRLYHGLSIDPVINCSDVMVTCVSSVGWEFMATGKPVVFFDAPEFFRDYEYCRLWNEPESRLYCNGGRDFGFVVNDTDKMIEQIDVLLKQDSPGPREPEKLEPLLAFNRGSASKAAADEIIDIIDSGRKARKPVLKEIYRHYRRRLIKRGDL